jgi:hypothetical protein
MQLSPRSVRLLTLDSVATPNWGKGKFSLPAAPVCLIYAFPIKAPSPKLGLPQCCPLPPPWLTAHFFSVVVERSLRFGFYRGFLRCLLLNALHHLLSLAFLVGLRLFLFLHMLCCLSRPESGLDSPCVCMTRTSLVEF